MGNVDAVTAGQRRRTIAGHAGRIDVVLADAFPDLSRARIQRLIAGGHALLNGECARKSAAVVEGDTLELALPPRSRVSSRAEECPDLAI